MSTSLIIVITQETSHPELKGTFYEKETDLVAGLDVLIYTEDLDSRPWLARVLKVLPLGKKFLAHWYKASLYCAF